MPLQAFSPLRGAERLPLVGLVGVLIFPLLVGVVLAAGVSSPQQNLNRITAAVVNNDQPVTIDGQTVPLGRELAAGLIGGAGGRGAPGDPVGTAASTTTTTTVADAATATDTGSTTTTTTTTSTTSTTTTTLVVTTTSSTSTTTPEQAEEAAKQNFTWILTNSDDAAAGLLDGSYDAVLTIPQSFSADASSISGAAVDAQAATVTVEMSPSAAAIDQALAQAVVNVAVTKLNETITSNYLSNVFEGFDTLNSSVAQLSDGADQLAEGTASLSSGADELVTGADQLAAGLVTLSQGAQTLADGVAELQQSVQSLPSQTQQLADGSAQVAAALDQASADLNQATQEAAAVVDTICQVPGAICDRATGLLQQLEGAAGELASLASGAGQVASGNEQLAESMPSLVDGVDSSATGANQVADGAATSEAGGASVAEGAANVASGAAQANDGAQQLAQGLQELLAQVPSYTPEDIATLSAVVVTPVSAVFPPVAEGTQSVPVIAAFALWLGALAMVIGLAVVAPSTLLTARSSTSLALRAAAPVAIIGAVQGVGVALVLLPFVDLQEAAIVYLAVAAAVGIAFAVINAGLVAIFGGFGRLVAALAATLLLAVGISSTAPQGLETLAALMPTAPGLALLRSGVGAGAGWTPFVGLALWAAIGVVLLIIGTSMRRSGRRLLSESVEPDEPDA